MQSGGAPNFTPCTTTGITLNYNIEWLLQQQATTQKLKYTCFWKPDPLDRINAACFSQWARSPFEVEGHLYVTAEHWMMAQKALLFDDEPMFREILAAPSPAKVQALGRKVLHFQQAVWEEKRYEIVVQGNWHKFGQHEAMRRFLLDTGDRVLVEASPVDRIWGIGLTADDERATQPQRWNGLNLLGFALMEVRERFANDKF